MDEMELDPVLRALQGLDRQPAPIRNSSIYWEQS